MLSDDSTGEVHLTLYLTLILDRHTAIFVYYFDPHFQSRPFQANIGTEYVSTVPNHVAHILH